MPQGGVALWVLSVILNDFQWGPTRTAVLVAVFVDVVAAALFELVGAVLLLLHLQ